MSVLVLTFLIHSLVCSPLFAQTQLPTSDDLSMKTDQSEDPDVTLDMKTQDSPIPPKNVSMFTPQPSNVPVRETTAELTPKNTAITVAETTLSNLETTIAAILKTNKVPSTETDPEDTSETTPGPSLENVTSSISQTLEGVTWSQTPIQTSHHVSRLVPTQAINPETLASTPSSSASQNDQSPTKSTEEDATSKPNPTETLTVVTPSIIPESAKTSFSKPSSDLKSTPTVGSAATSVIPITSSKTQGFVIVIIIIALLVCGILFTSMFFNKRRKRRYENGSFRNGGSSKSKIKKGTDDDVWSGPVALKGDEEVEAGDEGGNEVDGDGQGVQVVLSTFMAKEEVKDVVNGSCVGAKEDIKKDEEVPLLITDEDVEKAVAPSPPPSSSLSPVLSETNAGEQNGSPAFCLTSAV